MGRRKETFVRLRSSASPGDRALATRGLRACFFSAVGPQEPSAPVGVLTSRHKKELRNTLATAVPRSPIFFWLTGNRVLKTAFVLRDGPLAPKPLTPLGPSLSSPGANSTGARSTCAGHLRLRLRRFGIPHPLDSSQSPHISTRRVGCGGICLPAPYASSGARVSPPRIPGVARVGTRCSPDTPPEPQINEMLSW